jgi:hypothetical protein
MADPIHTPEFGDDDEEDNEDSWFDSFGEMFPFLLVALAGVYGIFFSKEVDTVERNPPVAEQRLDWAEHRDLEVARGLFRRMYRMDLDQFEQLVSLLRASLTVNEIMALNRSVAGAIIPELRLHCLLRWLAGGSYLDIVSKVNIHPSTFYPIVWSTCEAICACEQLGFFFPNSVAMASEIARGFESISTDGVVNGCIGAIDGWLMPIKVPPARFHNVTAYFSGHYQRYGLNVQAICDHQCRFLWLAIAAPGGQPDINAFRRTNLMDLLRMLSEGHPP